MHPREPLDGYPVEFDALKNVTAALFPAMTMRVHVRREPVRVKLEYFLLILS